MLSVEKLPPDPPCPQQLIKHSTDDDDDERASQIPAYPEVDLSKPTLLDDNLLPKFSIRDYVFTARSKDIKTNWPFSQKNLQLCLRHGVKDVLPPFQSVDSVRNQPLERCTVEDEHKSNILHAAPSGRDDHAVLDSSNNTKLNEKKLAEAYTDTTTSCRSEGENDFPSTITSVSQSEIEESVPTNRPSSLPPLETDTSLEAASVEVEPADPPPVVAHKTESTARPSGKKCRLVVKFRSHSERSSTEDIALNCTTISETMNSKICPVCKTFSSSSNTTLNAHIDQCLSGESAPKWTVDTKLTRHHRIKPGKTKLMVDIYATAQHCTLEDLDRRNGSNWATITSFPTQDKEKSEMPAEEKRQRLSSVHPDDIDVGSVYVDANGTKVRILSKFDDASSPSVSKVVEHLRPRKPLKRGKGSKFLSAKKQKRQASKYHKYLKLAPSKNFLSPKAHSSQIRGGQERYGVKESCEDGHEMEKQVNPCNPGALRGWACSKRTGVAKKLNKKEEPVKSKWHASRNFLVESNRVRKLVNSSGNPMSSPENSRRTENVFCETQASDKSDSQRKRAGSPLPGAGISDSVETFLQRNSHQLSKDRNFARDSCMPNLTNSNGSCAPLLSNNTVDTSAGPTDNFYSPDASTKPSKSRDDASRSNAIKFPSSKKKVRSVGGQLSVTESNAIAFKKCSAVEKFQVHERAETDKEVVAWDSVADQRYDFMHNSAGKRSRRGDTTNEIFHSRSTMLQTQNRGSISISGRKETIGLESSQLTPECYGHDEGEKMDTSVSVGNEFLDKVDGLGLAQKEDQIPGDDIVTETSFPIGVGETVASLCNSAKGKSNCLQCKGPLSETEALTSPTDPSIINEQEMFYADEVEDGTLGQNVHSAEEMDSEVGQGGYFPEVDPIPIPGPPGSFLPSPRDMGSDDFQGNSSLTTSRVQSSQEQLDFIDGYSSESPMSTTSTISNFTGTKCDLKYSEPLSSIGSQSVEGKIRLGLSRATIDSSVEVNADAAQQMTATAAERLTFDRENFKVNKISLERGLLSSKSNDQPCCCQRKERTSQGLALNYQDSQLLRRRAMASATLPAMGKQMGCHPNTRTNNLETRSDMTDIFFLSGCPTSRSEQVVFPVTKSPAGPLPLNDSPDGKRKLSGHSDGDSVSPSASNSILRLMGKNLMVVNRDEDPSVPPPGQAQPHAQINHLASPFPTFSGVAPANLQNQIYHPFHHNFSHGSVILGQDPHKKVGECFDAALTHSLRSYSIPKIPQVLAQGPASLFPKQHADGGFVTSMGLHEYKGDYNFPIPLNKPINKPIGASAFHMQRVISTPDRQRKNADPASNANKEIIIIDDVPENEAELSRDVASYSGGLRESQVVSSGISIPEAPSYNSKCVNPFSCYQSQDPSLLCGSPVLYNTNFHANISTRRANASPVKWGCTSEGSSVLQRSPFLPASSSRGHQLRSTLYNSPSLS